MSKVKYNGVLIPYYYLGGGHGIQFNVILKNSNNIYEGKHEGEKIDYYIET